MSLLSIVRRRIVPRRYADRRKRTGDQDTMSSTAVLTPAQTSIEPIAPWWHTVLLLVIIGAGSVASYYENGLPNLNLPGMSSRLSGYFTVIAMEWLTVLVIWLALRRQGLTFASLVGGRWQTL